MANQPDAAELATRKLRYRVYLVGSAFAAAGLTMGTMPVFTQHTPILVAKGCALAGAAILALGRFCSADFLQRVFRQRR
jgi:hypothetical protein